MGIKDFFTRKSVNPQLEQKMDEQLLQLTARALYEFIKNGHDLECGEGGAIAAFLACMEKPSASPTPLHDEIARIKEANSSADNQLPDYAPVAPEAEQRRIKECEREITDLKQRLDRAHREKESALAAAQTAEGALARAKAESETARTQSEAETKRHERQLASVGDALAQKEAELGRARQDYARLERDLRLAREQRLSEQDSLFELQTFLAKLELETRKIVGAYFDLDKLPVFLVQCGQFQRVNQLWEACGKAVANGASPQKLEICLRRILELYNRAAGANPAELLEPEPGSPYKSDCEIRIESDGTQVVRVLLPGLKNPGGKLMQHALVVLK